MKKVHKPFEHKQLSEDLMERMQEVLADHKERVKECKANGWKSSELVRHQDYGMCGFCLLPLCLKHTGKLKRHLET
jgi:hypothetical protein